MKRILILAAMLLGGFTAAQAQGDLRKGDCLINIGAGFIPGVGANASFDYGLVDRWGPGLFTIGGYAGVNFTGLTHNGKDYTRTNVFLSPRATYRYAFNSKFEVFASVMLGAVVKNRYDDVIVNASMSVMGGCRYFFTPNFGVFAEGGLHLDMTDINGGICFSF